WALNASHYAVDSESSNAGTTNSYSGSLLYGLTSALLASLSGGQEFENFQTGQRRHSWNWGAGLRWQPDERTTISAQTSKRFFGRGFNYLLSERFERSALQWSYSRELSTSSSAASLGQVNTLTNSSLSRYAAEYNAESAALESSIPDRVQRDRVVKEHLAARGISVFDLQQLDYLSGQASINRNMRLAWVLNGVRNSLTVSGHKSDRQAVSQQQIMQIQSDDLTTHQSVKEHGWDAVWRHSLTSLTTLGVRYALTDASGVAVNGQLDASRTNNVGVNVDTSLAPFTTGGVNFNYSRSTGTVEYRENSIAVYLNHRF
ncbi:MAG TPA: TIGR03016 family PEP-CTERM system-associated outer membrane protein, partial [Rhodocyclaceae bacterium]|nr:TIGR03016 family PEP-CTERM system-associated outer membrane protein [Rhodocyclaceae bacterium]